MRALLLLLIPLGAWAAPPEVPTTPVLARVGERPAIVTIAAKPGTEYAAAPAFAAEDCLWFPGECDPSGRKTYLVQPYRAGVYRVVFWTKGETAYSMLTIDATGGTVPPPPPPPPPPPTAGTVHFVIVRPDGPAAPAFEKVMRDSAWDKLREKGFVVESRTLTEARAMRIPVLATLPCVTTLRQVPGAPTSKVARGPVPLPTTPDEIAKLPEGVAP